MKDARANPGVVEGQFADEPICPYCGCEQCDAWEVSWDSGTMECDGCEKTFTYSRYTHVKYTTEPITAPSPPEPR